METVKGNEAGACTGIWILRSTKKIPKSYIWGSWKGGGEGIYHTITFIPVSRKSDMAG